MIKGVRVGNKGSKATHGRKCYANGGAVTDDLATLDESPNLKSFAMDDDMGVDGGRAKPRLDRKAAPVNVNVIVTSGKAEGGGQPLPPPPMAGPPPPMPMPPAGGPPMPPGLPMRAAGGRVCRADGGPVKGKPGTQSGDVKESESMERARAVQRNIGRAAQIGGAGAMAATTPGTIIGGGLATIVGSHLKKNADEPNIRDVYGDIVRTARKDGGRVTAAMSKGEGAGGGLGRLEKIKGYGAKAGKPAKGG